METLGKRIAQLRKSKNMRQDDLAQKLSISPQAVSKWENDQTCPDISLLPELARALDVSVDTLLSGEKAPETKLVPRESRKDIKDMMLRIVVDSRDGDKVRVNIPVALLQVALDVGMDMPQVSGNSAIQNIDLGQIMELIKQGVVGDLVQVESSDGDIVHIFVE